MSFRTLTSLAILALIAVVAVNMNRDELEQNLAMGSPDEMVTPVEPDEIVTPVERGVAVDRVPTEEIPDDEAMTTVNGTVTPDEISDEPIPEPSAERTPRTEEVLDDEPRETEYDQEGHPVHMDENRAEGEQSPKG